MLMQPDEGTPITFTITRYADGYRGEMSKIAKGQSIGQTLTTVGTFYDVSEKILTAVDACEFLGFDTRVEDRS